MNIKLKINEISREYIINYFNSIKGILNNFKIK